MSTLIEDVLIAADQLSFEQTVPRSLVHKESLENVLLTEVRSCGDDRFICAGRIPTAHGFFNSIGRSPQKDILFYTELGRQASLAISHLFLGVDRDEVFIFEKSQAEMTALPRNVHSIPRSVVTEIRVFETKRRRNNTVERVVAEQTVRAGGEQVFRGTGTWMLQPPALFQRLRRMSKVRSYVSGEPPLCESAARADILEPANRDNVITAPEYDESRTEFVTSLIVDETHPYFFDHPCDHVPGMLLLEGCSRLAVAAVAGTNQVDPDELAISEYGVNFGQFVESNLPITLTARVIQDESTSAGLTAVRICISQQGVVSGTTTMTVAYAN